MLHIYLLMITLVNVNSWQIAPINGNPFATIESCQETLEDIKTKHPTKFYGQYYTDMKCLTKAKNYLDIRH